MYINFDKVKCVFKLEVFISVWILKKLICWYFYIKTILENGLFFIV